MRLLESTRKELLVLLRDPVGLLVIFVMPLLFLLVITLLQDNTLKSFRETRFDAAIINLDTPEIGARIDEAIRNSHYFEIDDKHGLSGEQALRNAIMDGKYEVGILIPKGFDESIRKRTESIFRSTDSTYAVPEIEIIIDPMIWTSFKHVIELSIEKLVMEIERESMFDSSKKIIRQVAPDAVIELPDAVPLFHIGHASANPALPPNSNQQNVPAWTLFAMFFIALPLAGNFIRERTDGCFQRLLTIPGSMGSYLGGKFIVFMGVCTIQFTLMMLIGLYLLPVLGAGSIGLGSHPWALIVTVLSAAAAATGFGILIGAFAKTFDQASLTGAFSVVILSAIGGIIVPVYAMPAFFRKVAFLSPMNWAQDAFLAIFVRDADLKSLLPELIPLWIFFLLIFAVSLFRLRHTLND